MTKLLTFKLGMRFQHLRQCLVRSRQLELQRPGDQLVSGWTIVEVSAASVESSLWIVDNRGRVKYGNYQSQQSTSTSPGTKLEYAWLLTSSDYSQAEDPSLEMTLSTKTSDTVTRNVDFVQI